MSHVTAIKASFTDADLPFLLEAAKACGLELRKNTDGTNRKTFKWYGRWVNDYRQNDAAFQNGVPTEDYGKADYVFGIPGNNAAYELGLYRRADGKLVPVWDFWAGGHGLQKAIGREGEKFLQGYAQAKVLKASKLENFTVQSIKTMADGKIQIKLRPGDAPGFKASF